MEETNKTKFTTVDAYIEAFPPRIRKKLILIRKTIKKAVPDADEVVSYNMPGFKYKGMLAWYAAHQEHIGLYPTASPIAAFKKELQGYTTSKGAIQFPMEEEIPVDLITAILTFKANENAAKSKKPVKKK